MNRVNLLVGETIESTTLWLLSTTRRAVFKFKAVLVVLFLRISAPTDVDSKAGGIVVGNLVDIFCPSDDVSHFLIYLPAPLAKRYGHIFQKPIANIGEVP